MENRPSATRKQGAFQPSRTRLLQPSQLFKPSRSFVSSHPPSQHDDTKTHHQDDSTSIPRVPRFSSQPNFSKLTTVDKPQTPQTLLPFPSKSAIKPPTFPLRSANQPVLQTPKQQPVLISKNQPALQSISRPASSSPSKQQHLTKPHSTQPVVLPSANSHKPNVNLSVQQASVPYPLSTLPSQVLQAMSQDKRDGFIAGWSACMDAHPQCNHCTFPNAQKHPPTLTVSSAPSSLVSPTQHSSKTQNQCPPPPQSPHARIGQPIVPRKVFSSSGTTPTTARRTFPDPYATEQPSTNRTVGPTKRPRTSPPTNSTARPSYIATNPTAGQLVRSSTQALKPRSICAPIAQSGPTRTQTGNCDSRKRTSGHDAYLARGKLGDMQSVNAAFAAATTSDPVEYQRKKRRRNADVSSPKPRRPAETQARQEIRHQVEARPQQETRRPIETRAKQDIREPPHTRTEQKTRQLTWTKIRIDTRRTVDTRIRQEAERPVNPKTGDGAARSVEIRAGDNTKAPSDTRSRHEPNRPVEIRPRPQLAKTSMNVAIPNANASSGLQNAKNSCNSHVKMPTVSLDRDPRQKAKTSATKECVPASVKGVQPTTASASISVRQNSTGLGKRILPQPMIDSGSRCDLDRVRSSQESQEESGWGSALNAATTRERLSTCSTNAADPGKQKQHGVPGNTATEKRREPFTASERAPCRRQDSQCNVETEANSTTARIAEKEREKERDEITVQAYAERFGLVIVERDRESGKVEWVACKFCPVFGCRTRDPDYIMAHRAPFASKKFITHLEKDHCVKWNEYKQANAEEKGKFFSGKELPAKAFHDRVSELKRSQDGMARRRVSPGVTEDQEKRQIDRAVAKLAKQRVAHKVATLVMDTTDDCWVGRERFRNRSHCRSISVCQGEASARTTDVLPPLERISKCVKELEINSEIAGFILHGIAKDSTEEEWDDNDRGFTDTIVLEGNEMRPTTLIFSSVDKATASRIALTLRYLHDGMTGSICAALLQDMPETQAVEATSTDGGREVLGHANALMGLGMYILTSALSTDWRSWAVGLTTRSCRYVGGGAVEVLISMYDDDGEMRKAHLITVQEVDEAGAAVREVLDVVLPSWKQRLLGIHSEICKQTQKYEKLIEAAILTDVRKMTGRELMLVGHDVKREDNPTFPWGLAKMSELKFDELLSNIEEPLGLTLGKARLRAARAQRGDLFKRVLSDGEEGEVFREAWKIAGERAAEICVIAEGLRTVWLCDCDDGRGSVVGGQRRGQAVVDCDAERVLWARGLIRLWKWCGKVVTKLGMETP